MKRIIIILVAAIGMFGGNTAAQEIKYHTFVELNAGTSFARDRNIVPSDENYFYITDFYPSYTFGLTITGGVQITPKLFTGLGFGGQGVMSSYREGHNGYFDVYRPVQTVMLPVYADVHYNLFDLNSRRVNPFVDLKFGYQFAVGLEDDNLGWDYDHNYVFRYRSGVYFVPSVGVRFGRPNGFNLGIAYDLSLRRKFYRVDNRVPSCPLEEIGKGSAGVLMLTFGTDF